MVQVVQLLFCPCPACRYAIYKIGLCYLYFSRSCCSLVLIQNHILCPAMIDTLIKWCLKKLLTFSQVQIWIAFFVLYIDFEAIRKITIIFSLFKWQLIIYKNYYNIFLIQIIIAFNVFVFFNQRVHIWKSSYTVFVLFFFFKHQQIR